MSVELLMFSASVTAAAPPSQGGLEAKARWRGSGFDSSNRPVWIYEVRVRLKSQGGEPQQQQVLTFLTLTKDCFFSDDSENTSGVTNDRGRATVVVYCLPGIVGILQVSSSSTLGSLTLETDLKRPSWLARKKWWLLGGVVLAVAVCSVGCGGGPEGPPSVTIRGPGTGPAGPP